VAEPFHREEFGISKGVPMTWLQFRAFFVWLRDRKPEQFWIDDVLPDYLKVEGEVRENEFDEWMKSHAEAPRA
jgi:hypothetical protein